MNFKKAIVFALALAGSVFAADKTLVFYPLKDSVCVNDRQFAATCFTETGEKVSPWDLLNTVRIKILGAPEVDAYKYGIYIERPFFIVDGIHLSLTELRTLDQLQEETEAFGIPGILQAMGYTPILVQFSETVLNSLEYNADLFQKMLKFISSNKVVPFPNGPEEGFVVLGISQGGIIGRYGSYLYDIGRKPGDAPIRAFSSLDSPHQGAVMPRSLLNTIDFWAQWGDSPEAEGFRDLVRSPVAVMDHYDKSSRCNDSDRKNSHEPLQPAFPVSPFIFLSQSLPFRIDPRIRHYALSTSPFLFTVTPLPYIYPHRHWRSTCCSPHCSGHPAE